jgi:hypothetical protein
MGALGPAMIFVSLLLAEVLLGIVVLAYAARCVGVIVEGTAAGNDEVEWPDEPMFDWLGRAAHLLFLLALVLVPGALVGRLLVRLDVGLPPRLAFLPTLALFWVLFPIAVLSSFSALSPWVVVRRALLVGLARVFPATAAFYLVTAILLAGLGALGFFTFAGGGALLILVLAPAVSAAVFIYARLLGRLGGALGRLEREVQAEEADGGAAQAAAPTKRAPKKRRPVRGVKTTDPWAVPDEEPTPSASSPQVEGYDIASDEAVPKPVRSRKARKKKPREEGYALSPEPPPPRPREVPLDGCPPVGAETEPSMEAPASDKRTTRRGVRADRSTRHLGSRELPRPPAHPFLEGVYTFPWYSKSLPPWLLLSLGLLAMGGILLVLLSLWPSLQ